MSPHGAGRWRSFWRHLLLAGLLAGLLLAPYQGPPRAWAPLTAAAATALAGARCGPARRSRDRSPGWIWLALAVGTAAITGLGLGSARLSALAAGAGPGQPGAQLETTGLIAGSPKRSGTALRAPLETEAGRYLLVWERPRDRSPPAATGSPPELAAGLAVRVRGTLAEPDPWRGDELARLGARLELQASRLEALGPGRDGLGGLLDRVRGRAERGISAGLSPEQAALARGFVLGQADRIDELTREHFKRSGLAHLLAVSGTAVMLLAVLAGVLVALTGVGPRVRLALVIVVICIYVPVAGAGPSIQRAGVMGVAGLLATLAGRPADRAYLPLLAGVATLLLNPHSAADVGWQLSFSAVIGISLWAAPIRRLLQPRLGALPARLAAPVAEGAGLTLAATVATAPLMAHHFGSFPIASLPANLLVLAAVPPMMWLGMLASLLGQVPIVPTAPIGLVHGPVLDFIAFVARLLAAPEWALVEVQLSSPAAVAATYLLLVVGVGAALAGLARRRGLGPPPRWRLLAGPVGAAGVLLLLSAGPASHPGGGSPARDPRALRITALDVGQGDAILLESPRAAPVLVDTGPPAGGIGRALERRGIERLGALVLTHGDLDHVGALDEVLDAAPPRRIFTGGAGPIHGVPARPMAAGDALRLGPLRLQVLWPPPGRPPAASPNHSSLVLLAGFRGWSVLLSGDAEQEVTAIDPGPIDVLKIAHHGSADAGLEPLLATSIPRLALISAGAANGYGHPTPGTLAALAASGACVLRTDRHGDAWVELGRSGLRAATEHGREPCGDPDGA